MDVGLYKGAGGGWLCDKDSGVGDCGVSGGGGGGGDSEGERASDDHC